MVEAHDPLSVKVGDAADGSEATHDVPVLDRVAVGDIDGREVGTVGVQTSPWSGITTLPEKNRLPVGTVAAAAAATGRLACHAAHESASGAR